jgi:antitoxin ParD1/3/4
MMNCVEIVPNKAKSGPIRTRRCAGTAFQDADFKKPNHTVAAFMPQFMDDRSIFVPITRRIPDQADVTRLCIDKEEDGMCCSSPAAREHATVLGAGFVWSPGEEAGMNVSIGERWETFVDRIVREGRYGSASEVVREGLRLVEEREARLKALRTMLDTAPATSEAGESDVDRALETRIAHLVAKGGDQGH